MADRRKRAPNFSAQEKEILVELVGKYFHVIENTETNGATQRQKGDAWCCVGEEFNSSSTTCYRDPETLRGAWENLKKGTKKISAAEKRQIIATGELYNLNSE